MNAATILHAIENMDLPARPSMGEDVELSSLFDRILEVNTQRALLEAAIDRASSALGDPCSFCIDEVMDELRDKLYEAVERRAMVHLLGAEAASIIPHEAALQMVRGRMSSGVWAIHAIKVRDQFGAQAVAPMLDFM